MFYQTQTVRRQPITPGSDGMVLSTAAWRCLQRACYKASCSRTDHSFAARGWWECTVHLLSLVKLTFDLDIQTRPSEWPNTSSLWIWRKSVQPFQRYLIHKQTKKWQTAPKQNLMQFTACGKKTCAIYLQRFSFGTNKRIKPRRNRLTQVHLENGHYKRGW